ncbi:26S proteasome regulatory subunit 7, partial [Dictyocoela roeselum]
MDQNDVNAFLNYGKNHYSDAITDLEREIQRTFDAISIKIGTKEVETGLSPPSTWNLLADRNRIQTDQPLQVATLCKIIKTDKDYHFMINVRQMAKFIVGKRKNLDISALEEGMRVGVDRMKDTIVKPLPRKIDASVTLMQVEEKPDVTYDDVGGCKEEIEKIKEVVEMPLINPDRYIELG